MSEKNDIPGAMSRENAELLQKSNKKLSEQSLADLIDEPDRFRKFSRELDGLLYDFTRVQIDAAALGQLLEMVEGCGLRSWREKLFAGAPVNSTEHRPVLHMAIRSVELLNRVGGEEAAKVKESMRHALQLADQLHDGQLPGEAGTRIRHIVHVGIGGSLLGPQLLCEALDRGDSAIQVHFLGSVDAGRRARLQARLDPAETVVVLVSKSFTTGDTLMHGRRLREWLRQQLGEAEASKRLFAVTSQAGKARAFGINPSKVIYFPDWVGGRYSVWSPVSLAAAAVIGTGRFHEFLAGAAAMDRHFEQAPAADNLPVLFAMVGVWHRNFCAYGAWGVMPYDFRLRLLPAYLQQLVMESNGKSITRGGLPSGLATAPVVFGETGTEAQHSVFQALHQGSDVVPLNFVGVIRPDHDDTEAHDELMANLLAQITALARGRSMEETRAALGAGNDGLLAHRSFAGQRPSDLIMLDELSPARLGMLLALYEHKVFVESLVWDINAFDQWGVELGKTLAPGIQSQLESSASDGSSLAPLLDHIRQRRQAG